MGKANHGIKIIQSKRASAHQRTDKSSVAVHFKNAAQSLEEMAVMVIDQLHSLDPTLR